MPEAKDNQPFTTPQVPTGPEAQPAQPPSVEPVLPPIAVPPQKNSKRKWYIVAVLAVIIIGGVAAWALTKKDKAGPAASNAQLAPVNVHLGWLHQAQFAGFYVAKEKGFYKQAGLNVSLKEYQDGEDVNQEISDGKVDFGTTTPLEVIATRDKGAKVKAVAAIYQTSPYSFVSPKTSNIKTPSDLKGKVLGYVGNNTEAQVAYPALYTSYGITSAQVTVKNIDFDIVKDFQDHVADTADVYRTDQTYLLKKAGIEYNLLLPEQFGFNIYGDVILTSDSIIDNRPGFAAKFTQATLKGMQYAIDHPDEALTMTAKYENALYKDPAYEKYVLENSIPLIKTTGGQKLGNMQFVPWNRAVQSIKSVGLLKTNVEVNDVYTDQFVK